jgi:hypothetical protein
LNSAISVGFGSVASGRASASTCRPMRRPAQLPGDAQQRGDADGRTEHQGSPGSPAHWLLRGISSTTDQGDCSRRATI